MNCTAYLGAEIFDGERLLSGRALIVTDGMVEGMPALDEIPDSATRSELPPGILAPGFVDLQANGGDGLMFNDRPDVESLRRIAAAHGRLGSTSILPTLISGDSDMVDRAVEAVAQAIAEGVPGIAGLHLEGPHLDSAKRGAHEASRIRPMDDADEAKLVSAARRLPTLMVTLAPASAGPDRIARLCAAGVVVSLGHSECTFAEAEAATEAGARCVTHLFNAMAPVRAREPGLAGAAIALGGLSAGLIADLVHVHPAAIRLALSAKAGPGEVFLVTDSMATAGSKIREFELDGRAVKRDGGRLVLADGTLAGADLEMARAIRNLADLGVSPSRALAMSTSIPARVAGAAPTCGSLASGRAACMSHLDRDLNLTAVWRDGAPIWSRDGKL